MNVSEHSRILTAYIGRLKLHDLRNIVELVERCWREQANGNAGSQDKADLALRTGIMEAVGNMLSHDRNIIADTVTALVTREAA